MAPPFRKKEYQQICADILDEITEGKVAEGFLYDKTIVKFALTSKPVKSVSQITGVSKGADFTFEQGRDYRIVKELGTDGEDQWLLEWLDNGSTELPDQDTEFRVDYQLDLAPLLTDKNVGSVLRTMVEAVSREIEYLYLQMEEVYNSAFIDKATGNSLDLVVSILGNENRRQLDEDDDELRERAKRALYVSGKATIESIRETLKQKTKGIATYPKIIDRPGNTNGIIRIILDGEKDEDDSDSQKRKQQQESSGQMVSAGGSTDRGEGNGKANDRLIRKIVDATRAAGVYAEIAYAERIAVNLHAVLTIKSDSNPQEVKNTAEKKIANYFSKLEIGEPIDSSEIIFSLRQIRGVRNARILITREGSTEASEKIVPGPEEKLHCLKSIIEFDNVHSGSTSSSNNINKKS